MKSIPFLIFAGLVASKCVLAETSQNSTRTLNSAICSDNSQLTETFNKTSDLMSELSALVAACPDNAVQIAALASNLNPSLTREIYLVLFSDVVDDQRVQLAVDAVRSIDQERRADVVQAAIESAPQELAQAIVDAVAEAGLMDPTEIIIAAIAGGADPGSITEPTAAGIATPPPIALAPGLTNTFGTGNGNGGGTASPN
ncbi:hypothetical protein KTC41_08990 [Vibrio cholerae]|nr:hypothetical protein KTC41_08990 [Vibrio cholerae]